MKYILLHTQSKQQRSLSPSPPKKSYTRLDLPENQRPRSASPTVPMTTEDDSKSAPKDMEAEKKLVGNKHTKELEPHDQVYHSFILTRPISSSSLLVMTGFS